MTDSSGGESVGLTENERTIWCYSDSGEVRSRRE